MVEGRQAVFFIVSLNFKIQAQFSIFISCQIDHTDGIN